MSVASKPTQIQQPSQPQQNVQQPTQSHTQSQEASLRNLESTVSKLTEEKDAIYNSLANAEAYIEQLLAENKNLQQKIQSQLQPQPTVNTVAESAKVQSLTQ